MDSPSGSYLAGLVAGHNKDYSVAADLMLHALEAAPENPRLIAQAFLLTAGDGRHQKAVELAERLLKVSPEQALAHLVLAMDGVKRADWALVNERLGAFPRSGINTLTLPMFEAWAHVATGDVDLAVSKLEEPSKKEGFHLLYGVQLALLNDVAGRNEAAETAYLSLIEQSKQASLRQVQIVANFFRRQGDDARARALYDEYLQDDPENLVIREALQSLDLGEEAAPLISSPAEAYAEILFNFASLLAQEKAYDAALVYAYQALYLRPDYEAATILLGEIMQVQGRSRAAIATYRKVNKDSPYAWSVGLRIADELEAMGQEDAAVEQLDRLTALQPERFEPYMRKGHILRGKEDFAKAVKAYDKAIARIDTDDQRFWTLFYFRGICFERISAWDKAEADFFKALELSPEQPFVLNYLAYSWVEQERNLDKAQDMLIKAVELRPDDGYIVDSLGWVYYRLGKYRDAVKHLERAIELRSEDPTINDHLGDAYWRVGRHHEARFQWRRALSFEPAEDQVELIRRKIESGLGQKVNGS